jgi:hypothetical protein
MALNRGDWPTTGDLNGMLLLLDRLRTPHTRLGRRRLRLFGCACVRRIWHLLERDASRRAVEVAERFADGRATEEQLAAAYQAARPPLVMVAENDPGFLLATVTHCAHYTASPEDRARYIVWVAHGVAFAETRSYRPPPEAFRPTCDLLREVFGDPFRPLNLSPAWLSWNRRAVPALAQAVHEEQAFDRLPILADLLEDAGGDNAELLGHLRGPGSHVRGCWALELLRDRITWQDETEDQP